MTAAQVAERVGISRGLVHRLESGAPGVSMGAAFEVAGVVGLRLFDLDEPGIFSRLTNARSMDVLLPRSVRRNLPKIDDNF